MQIFTEIPETSEKSNVTEGVTSGKTLKNLLSCKPKVWVQVNCEQGSPITVHIENLPPFDDGIIEDSLIDDECLGFALLMRGENCTTYNREIPEAKRLVISYIFKKERKKHSPRIKSTSVKIDFLISNDENFRPSKFKDPQKFDDTEARAFLANEIFYFAKHLQKVFEARYQTAISEQIAPDYLSIGEIRNKGGKIFVPPAVDNPLKQFAASISSSIIVTCNYDS